MASRVAMFSCRCIIYFLGVPTCCVVHFGGSILLAGKHKNTCKLSAALTGMTQLIYGRVRHVCKAFKDGDLASRLHQPWVAEEKETFHAALQRNMRSA